MTIVTIHINDSGLKRKSEAFETLRVLTHEEHFQALKMCNLIRGPKFIREGGSAEVGQKAQVCGFFFLKSSHTKCYLLLELLKIR